MSSEKNDENDKNDDDSVLSTPVCGNDISEEGEYCDSNRINCTNIDSVKYKSGSAVCNDDCSGYDTSSCVGVPDCGNNIVEVGEACDGNAKLCSEINPDKYVLGAAPCFDTCSGWDSKVCKTYTECGNGHLEELEPCERFTTKECTELNSDIYTSGTAECYDDCSGWNVSNCKVVQCKDAECGSVIVVENDFVFEFKCGECGDDEVCTSEKKCVIPCDGGKCGEVTIKDIDGEDLPFQCRDCNDLQYCNDENECVPACSNMGCGDDHGYNCGECPDGFYCSTYPNRCKKLPNIPVDKVSDGTFYMGCNTYVDNYCNEVENPYHEVYVSSYFIGTYEVTVEEYLLCIDSGLCSEAIEDGSHYRTYDENVKCNIGSDRDSDQPANCINYYGAEAFCKFVGGRLPTEAEWEKAARGGCEFYDDCEKDTPMFPWGNEWATCEYAVIINAGTGITGCDTGGTFPVASKPDGVSPYGLYDMAGNVWEWVSDWFDADYYDVSPYEDPKGPESGDEKILKGGSCNFSWATVRSSYRYDVVPSMNYTFGGFRCVFDSED